MAAFKELFGETLQTGSGTVSTVDALSGKSAVAIYFSAHWCPPCRGFTPKLAEWYKADLKAKGLEVVFVSSDRDDDSFKEYFADMPWLALPFDERERKGSLSKKFKVNGIPALIVLDSDGNLTTDDGRSAVSEDPTGKLMPWKPKTAQELLTSAKIVDANGKEISLKDALEGKKALGLYFSAHWCPPCRGFTPKLAEWYTADLKNKGLEVVFVSWDRSEDQFKEYVAEMPWLSLKFGDEAIKPLGSTFKVDGIPSLVILDKDLSTINAEGRGVVSSDPTGKEFPWYPKPVNDLASGPGQINEVPTVLVFCETSDEDQQKAIYDALAPLGQKYLDKQKAGGDLEFTFLTAKAATSLAIRIRGMVGLPSLPPAPHEHPLEKQAPAMGWVCDGCGGDGSSKDRHRCTKGCDFDFCGDCNKKASSGSTEKLPPRLVLIDIPSDGAYYVAPEHIPITTSEVEQFLSQYAAGKLERMQLS